MILSWLEKILSCLEMTFSRLETIFSRLKVDVVDMIYKSVPRNMTAAILK